MKRWLPVLFVIPLLTFASDDEADLANETEQRNRIYRTWENEFWQYAESLNIPWLTAHVASWLIGVEDIKKFVSQHVYKDPSILALDAYTVYEDTKIKVRQLIDKVVLEGELDAHTVYVVSHVCGKPSYLNWCRESRYDQLLMALQPESLYVYAQFIQAEDVYGSLVIDNEANRKILQLAATAEITDSLYSHIATDIPPIVDEFNAKNPALINNVRVETGYEFDGLSYAMNHAMSRLVGTMRFAGLCGRQAENDRKLEMQYCSAISDKLKNDADNLHDKSVGYSIEKKMLEARDPTDPEILRLWREQRMWPRVMACLMPDLGLSEEEYFNEMKQWLKMTAELGEIEGTREYAFQAFADGRTTTPNDPKICDLVWELDEEDWAELLGNGDPKSIFNSNANLPETPEY